MIDTSGLHQAPAHPKSRSTSSLTTRVESPYSPHGCARAPGPLVGECRSGMRRGSGQENTPLAFGPLVALTTLGPLSFRYQQMPDRDVSKLWVVRAACQGETGRLPVRKRACGNDLRDRCGTLYARVPIQKEGIIFKSFGFQFPFKLYEFENFSGRPQRGASLCSAEYLPKHSHCRKHAALSAESDLRQSRMNVESPG